MPRPKKWRNVCAAPRYCHFGPRELEAGVLELRVEEYECIRLIDLEGLTQEQCAAQMGVSRATAQVIYQSARRKLARCLVEGHALIIGGGDYRLCEHGDGPCDRGCHRRRCQANSAIQEKEGISK